jgi:small-conductance mechanosensitive channel
MVSIAQILILNLCALPCVWILPKQKREIQELLATKAVTPRMALICVTVLVLCLCWSLLGNFMAVFPQTSCLKIVGGKGCN